MAAFRTVATALCLLASTAAFAADPLPRAKPEEVGLSSERLAKIGATLNADIEAGRIPGAVIAIARRGKLVALDAYGFRDKAANVADDHRHHLQHRLDDETDDGGRRVAAV